MKLLKPLSDVMKDGKFKLNEMITLMNVLVKNVRNIDFSDSQIDNEDFAILLKLIIIVLDETNVIDTGKDIDGIFNSIDSSVFLIDQFQEINIEKNDDKPKKKGFTVKFFCIKFTI